MIKNYIKSQSGAALLLVLFVVLFLSITGAVLLNATTYSMKSIERNEIKENEFYILEGALDLALFNLNKMQSYNGGTKPLLDINGNRVYMTNENRKIPLLINKIGIYFFIKDYLNGDFTDTDCRGIFENVHIGDKEIKFSLCKTEKENNYKLSATFVDSDSLISSRNINLEFELLEPVETYDGGVISRNDYIQSPTNLYDKKKIHQNRRKVLEGKYLGGINFTDKMNAFGLSVPLKLTNLTPSTIIVGSPAYYDDIVASNKEIITIPKDKIVYANSLQWIGQNRTLIVKGTLIIRDFNMHSSGNLEIKNSGTLIANNFSIGSNSPNIVLPSDSSSEGGVGSPKFTSDVDWIVNDYVIDDYQTVR